MEVGEFGERASGVIHEHAAAMNGRAHAVGRDEENFEFFRIDRQVVKAVQKVAGEWSAECFRIGDCGEGAGPPTGRNSRWCLKEGPE